MVLEIELPGCEAGERQQTEARQRSDDTVAINETGQGEAELGQFRVVSAHAAHGDEGDGFHGGWLLAIWDLLLAPPLKRARCVKRDLPLAAHVREPALSV